MVCERVRPHAGCLPAVNGCHSGVCGGTALCPHAMPDCDCRQPCRALCPPPPTVPFTLHFITRTTHPAVHSIGREGERRRRRRRRKSQRHSRPSVGLAGPERLHRSACRLKVMLLPTLKILACISPLSSMVDVPLEIHRDAGGFTMRRRSRRRRSLVLAVFDGIEQFRRAAAAVMPVWFGLCAATSWFCLGIGLTFF